MAHLFVELNGSHDAPTRWKPSRLDDRSPFPLNGPAGDRDCPEHQGQPLEGAPPAEPSRPPAPAVVAAVFAAGAPRAWVLLSPRSAGVAINGRPVLLGLHVLGNRDRIVVDYPAQTRPAEYYFSSEEPATIEPYPGPEPVLCPRCKWPIEPGDPAVRCPACRFWHHQIEPSAQPASGESGEQSRARRCWTYLDRCANCPASTALDGALTWTPDEL